MRIYRNIRRNKGLVFGGTIQLQSQVISLSYNAHNPVTITSAHTCSVIVGLAVIARSSAGRSPQPLAVTVRSSALRWPPRRLGTALEFYEILGP